MARAKKKPAKPSTPPAPTPPAWPRVVEVYGDPSWRIRDMASDAAPSFVNELRIERYRITIEKIDDPPIVLLQRLRGLWRTMRRNSHTWDDVWECAQTLGLSEAEAREMFNPDMQGVDRKQ